MNEEHPTGVTIHRLDESDASAMLEFVLRNREFLTPFEPRRPASYGTPTATRARLADPERIEYGAFTEDGRLVGQVAIANVSTAPVYLNCTLGYSVDEHEQGRGIATAMVRHAVDEAFSTHGLHRVEAGTLLDNHGSQRVLLKVGFTRIGVSPRHVKIAGTWQDHVLFAITSEARGIHR